jgi:SagB-type dehydrogenase family enzyme
MKPFDLFLKSKPNIPPEQEWPDSWKTVYYKLYERAKTFLFNEEAEGEFETLLLARNSAKSFSGKPLALGKLHKLLRYAAGTQTKRPDRRTYASGGARYAVEVYYINNFESGEFVRGLYHFNPKDNSLSLVKTLDTSIQLANLVGSGYEFINDASGLVIFTGVFERVLEKYEWLGLRLCLFDIGEIVQNLSILGEKYGLLYRPLAGFSNEKVDTLLNIDGASEATLLTYAVGER